MCNFKQRHDINAASKTMTRRKSLQSFCDKPLIPFHARKWVLMKTHLLLTNDTVPCYQVALVELQNFTLNVSFKASNSLTDSCASLLNNFQLSQTSECTVSRCLSSLAAHIGANLLKTDVNEHGNKIKYGHLHQSLRLM